MRKLFISGLIIFAIFFISGTVTWFAFDKAKYEKQNYNKTFDNHFNQLSLSTIGSEINIVKGKKFKVDYQGDNDVYVSKKGKMLKVTEKRATNRGYGLNFNPFHHNKKKLTITVPNEQLKELSAKSVIGDIHLRNINASTATIINNRYFSIEHSNLKDLNVDESNNIAYICNSSVKNGNVKIGKGKLTISRSDFKDSIFLLNEGDINMNKMKPSNDIKASTKKGDINYNFEAKPKNTLLKLHPGRGEKVVNNNNFKDGKVGKSKNILEFYTVDGDIVIN